MLDILLAAAQQCSYVSVPEPSELAMQYYNSGNILWLIQQFWSLAVPLFILITGWSGKINAVAWQWGKKWYFSLIIYLFLFISLFQLLNLPLDFYSEYIRKHAYGLSNQNLERWFSGWGKSVLVLFLSSIAFIWIFYLLLKKSPRRWWFYSSLTSIAILFFMVFVQPIWVAPFFNHFGPMKNQKLEQQILALASRAGIEKARVFEVDMSHDTKEINAYVTGFGASHRIVLWDTTVQKLTPSEVLFVMGHEMGHYVLHHVWWELIFYSLLIFAIFYLTYRSARFLLNRYSHRFGFSNLYEFASLPLLLFLFVFFNLLFSPLLNLVSRYYEHEADRFGLEITQNNQAAAEAFIALQQENLANPRPGIFYIIWRAAHPSLGSRIDFANSYCPWEEGKSLKYGGHFKKISSF